MISAGRFYSLLLLAFPRQFRKRHGASMRVCFEERYREAVRQHRRTSFLASTLTDVLTNATLERRDALRQWLLFPNFHEQFARHEQERRPMIWQAALIDLRYAIRMFLRTPVFTSLTVIALALGIGANTAIFSVVNGVLLKPLPFAQSDRLVMVWTDNKRENLHQYPMSPADFIDLKASVRSLDRLEMMYSFLMSPTLQTASGAEVLSGAGITPGMFDLLGQNASLGRTLQAADKRGVVVLSDTAWRRRFGADPGIVGRELTIDAQPATVVGVMPPGFHFPLKSMLGPSGFSSAVEPEVWLPLDLTNPQFLQNGQPARLPHYLSVLGRLGPGVKLEQAREEIASLAAGLERQYPEINRGLASRIVPLHEQAVGRVKEPLYLLLAGVGLVLLMACVNVANLLLARSVSRQKEIAVRVALGAGRVRLLAQMLVEGLFLSTAGGLLGLVLGWVGVRALISLAPPEVPRLSEVSLDGSVLLFTFMVSMIVGAAVGLAPALATASGNVQSALKDASRGVAGGVRRRRMRAGLIVAEVGLAVVLTVGAGLLVRSFVTLLDVDPGFRSENLLTMQIQLPSTINTPDARRAFYAAFFEKVEALPGVVSTGGTTRLPLGSTNVSTRVLVEGRALEAASMPEVEMRRAVHNFFGAMGVPVLRGRSFGPEDTPLSPPVLVINETMARRLWPNEDAIGKHLKQGTDPATPWSTVIGVIGDVRHAGLDSVPTPEMYIWYLQGPPVAPFIVVRTQGDPNHLLERLRSEMKTFEKDLAVQGLRPMTEVRSASVAERRFILILTTAFGVLALVLAAVGVYGVMALVVGERTQEIGIRLALGALPLEVLKLVVRQGMTLAVPGVGIGVLVALALTPTMASQLYGISPADPATLVGVPGLLLLVALFACIVPARRAMRVDATTALRCE
jgi:predicted permease